MGEAVFMLRSVYWWVPGLLVIMLLAGCASEPPPDRSGLQVVSPMPTLDDADPERLCQAVAERWGQNWPEVIRALEILESRNTECDNDSILNRLHSAYLIHGAELEEAGRREDAIRAYQMALRYDFTSEAAAENLRRLDVLTPEPFPSCPPDLVSRALAVVPSYEPTQGEFVQVSGDRLMLAGWRYPVHGINYYPRDYPGWRFLTQMVVRDIEFELDLIRATGFNVLRIFLRPDDLFVCPGNGAIPIPHGFQRLDDLIQAAAGRGFKLILVLNHEVNLRRVPLYDSPPHTLQQMAYIAARYRDEPAVMAYDLRDRADADYLAVEALTRERVLNWLAEAARMVRQNAPRQLVTAGWERDAAVTVPLVDFVSFQHYGDLDALRQEIAVLKAATAKPVLLAAVGYHTLDGDEVAQRDRLQHAIEAAERNLLAGWVVWTAFDYPLTAACIEPNCPGERGPDNHYGIWGTSYFPKPAVEVIRRAAGLESGN
jgi:hypothetical protein